MSALCNADIRLVDSNRLARRLPPPHFVSRVRLDVMAFPKKISAYMAYSNVHRDAVKRGLIESGVEKPSIADVARAISARWNALSDDERAVRTMRARCTRAVITACSLLPRALDDDDRGRRREARGMRARDRRRRLNRARTRTERKD